MTKDEALRLALEALENIDRAMPFPVAKLAIKECKAALEAKDKPVHPDIKKLYEDYFDKCFRESSPPQRTEPVCPECKAGVLYECVACSSNNYPPQHTWVGLTEEDLKLLSSEWRIVYGAWMDDFAKDIEAKLKEKNNG